MPKKEIAMLLQNICYKAQKARHFDWTTIVPLVAVAVVLCIHRIIPNYENYKPKVFPHFGNFLTGLLMIFLTAAIASLFFSKLRSKYAYKSWFYGAAVLLLGAYDFISLKVHVLPSLYFPSPERVLQVYVEDWAFILKCLLYSLRLLGAGFTLGALTGIGTGVLIGWSSRWNYWISPLIRIVGPIPSTAWIPIALVVFTKATEASVFLIALGVWFPTTILTSSGIANVRKSYFEVSSTLGAGTICNIFKIAVPAAAPNIFTGLFNGTSSSFLTLMSAEMLGCKFGIGWYINWQRETLAYSNVYAALIVIAITFSFLISLQIRIRNRVLTWQKGTIRW